MAPEQATVREITPATDVFALGQVAAYAAIGAPASGLGPSHAVLHRVVHVEPDLPRCPSSYDRWSRVASRRTPPGARRSPRSSRSASPRRSTLLRRPDQWLPAALTADIHARAAGYTPTQ